MLNNKYFQQFDRKVFQDLSDKFVWDLSVLNMIQCKKKV